MVRFKANGLKSIAPKHYLGQPNNATGQISGKRCTHWPTADMILYHTNWEEQYQIGIGNILQLMQQTKMQIHRRIALIAA